MVILLNLQRKTIILLITVFLIGCGSAIFLRSLSSTIEVTTPVDEETKTMVIAKIQEIFLVRNKALLEGDTKALAALYNRGIKYGQWAYEHQLKKVKYMRNWSSKQGVQFKNVSSHVVVRYVKGKGSGYTANLLVSTEYTYEYEGSPNVTNSFRIGTYHSIDLQLTDESIVITREWYKDPFADSLQLDDLKNQEIRQQILAAESNPLTNLHAKRVKAQQYLDQFCGAATLPEYGFQYNPKYQNYNYLGGDCANFASQMLYEAGGFRKNGTWNYERGSGSKAWVNAHAFNQYMINSGRATRIAYGSYDKVLKSSYRLLPGDYVAYEKKGKVEHISLVSGVDSKGYALVNSHNADRYRVPWDLGWNNKGVRFWLVRVHY